MEPIPQELGLGRMGQGKGNATPTGQKRGSGDHVPKVAKRRVV